MNMEFLKEVASKTGMLLNTKEQHLVGEYRGYFISVSAVTNAKKLVITTSVDMNSNDEGKAENKVAVTEAMHKFTQENAYVDYYTAESYTVKAVLNAKKTNENGENVMALLNHLTGMLRQNGLVACCSVCGEVNFVSPYSVNGVTKNLCINCFNSAKDKIAEEQIANAKSSSNVFMGVVGSLLGALIGGALWVLIYQLGYVAGIAGLATIACAYKGYTMFSKRKDVKAVVISIIISIAVLFFAHMVCWAIDLYSLYSAEYIITIFDMIKIVPEYIKDPEFTMYFFQDLLIGYGLMAVASVSFIKSAIKNPTKSASIEKINLNVSQEV